MDNQIQNSIVSFIWGIADDCLRDVYVRGKYRDVILPMTVIRRLDAMLEDTKTDVLKMKDTMDKAGITNQWPALCNAADQAFCNASPFLLKDLTSRAKKQTLKADFEAYLDGFSPNVQEILEKFKFRNQIDTMIDADISNTELVNVVNRYIDHDGYKLVVSDTIGDKNFYKCISTRIGVQGEVKNIIFAAKYKPEIVFDDALNNDIRITKNENQCLIYNRPIPPTGVMWNDLVDWYAEEKNIDENREIVFIKRLCECLDTSFKAQGAKSGPETWMLQAYYNLKKELGKDLPALIPQVYLYYDPQTLKQRGYKLFEHQKMDFLMVFSHKDRVVIEIDGRQHYAEGNSASPRLYSEMVRAQREMTLFGYDVYRFGGYEFVGADSDEKKKEAVLDDLKQFFLRLFSKYSAL